jgi:chromosome condensin MukBEF MukE localization factor
LIRRQTQSLLAAKDGSGLTPDMKLMNLVQKLQLSIALDTVRNEYMLRPKLHAWLVADPVRSDVDMLNEKVYAELFLTPKTDPWLGLFSPETYMALERGGVAP